MYQIKDVNTWVAYNFEKEYGMTIYSCLDALSQSQQEVILNLMDWAWESGKEEGYGQGYDGGYSDSATDAYNEGYGDGYRAGTSKVVAEIENTIKDVCRRSKDVYTDGYNDWR